jgi:2-polyprenyl-6-methoxyphenol hydroxylase-like FAD-dependent oxidoreductase
LRAIEQLLPRLEDDLRAAGGSPMAFWSEFRWLLAVGPWLPQWPAQQHLVISTRVLLEHIIRRRVQETGRVRFIDGHEVTGLLLSPARVVNGVRVVARSDGNAHHELPADLIVDAAGRRSGLPSWLSAHGLKRPTETIVDPHVGYATRLLTIPDGFAQPFKGMYIQLAPPSGTRGGIFFPIEGNRWVVTLLGACQDYPPTDEAGYLDFARSLRSQELYDAIKDAAPASPIWGHRHTANQRRHFERLRKMPAGLLVVGDSLCAFNPIYGQGMTVAALQALKLNSLVRNTFRGPADVPMLSRTAQKAMAGIAHEAWTVSATQDLRYPVTVGPKLPIRMLHRYMDAVVLAASVDETIANTFLNVLNMLASSAALRRPQTMLRVLRGARRARWLGRLAEA